MADDATSRRILRAAALIGLLAGAVGSLGLMLYAGRHAPRILILPFAIWVISPFVALAWAHVVLKRWSGLARATLYCAMVVVTLGSLAAYGDVVLRPPKAQAAFVFVVVPPASWLLSGIALLTAALISGKPSR